MVLLNYYSFITAHSLQCANISIYFYIHKNQAQKVHFLAELWIIFESIHPLRR